MTRPGILYNKIPSPQGENMPVSLRDIRNSSNFGGRVMTLPYNLILP